MLRDGTRGEGVAHTANTAYTAYKSYLPYLPYSPYSPYAKSPRPYLSVEGKLRLHCRCAVLRDGTGG